MAHRGQTLDNPVTGERIRFLRTSADTAGELLEFEMELAPDGRVPGAHVHPEQEERFHVLAGTMTFRLGLRRIVAHAGDTVVVPAGRAHRFANGGEGTARVRVEVEPGARHGGPADHHRRAGPRRRGHAARACRGRCRWRCSSGASAARCARPSRPRPWSAPRSRRSPSSRGGAASPSATRPDTGRQDGPVRGTQDDMKPFVVNRHGRLVFPSNFLPELDFSVLDGLEQLDAVIARDFEAKAPDRHRHPRAGRVRRLRGRATS